MHGYCTNHPYNLARAICSGCGKAFCAYCIAPQVIQVVQPEWLWNYLVGDYRLVQGAPTRSMWMVCLACMAKMPPYVVMPAPAKPPTAVTTTINTNGTAAVPPGSYGLANLFSEFLFKGEVTVGSSMVKLNPYQWGTSPITPKKQTRRGHQHRERNVLEEDLAAFLEAGDAED